MTNVSPDFLRSSAGCRGQCYLNIPTTLMEKNSSLQQKMTSTVLVIGCLILLIPLFSAGKLNTLLKLQFQKKKNSRRRVACL